MSPLTQGLNYRSACDANSMRMIKDAGCGVFRGSSMGLGSPWEFPHILLWVWDGGYWD